MEGRLRVLLLVPLIALTLPGCSILNRFRHHEPKSTEAPAPQTTSDDTVGSSNQQVINPEVSRRKIKVPKIDHENFELGAYAGILSIEDFGVNAVYGARFAYHITEDFFLEGTLAKSRGGRTSFEELSGSAQILTDSQRDYTYYAINAGWNALPGEIFIGKNRAYNTAMYFDLGIGATRFAGDNRFTANGGIGYRILFNDWIAAHVDFRDYVFDIDLLGHKKVDNNLEATLGLSVFF
jgi:outer membrane beta-barrel protein